jgi:hypothetical protein
MMGRKRHARVACNANAPVQESPSEVEAIESLRAWQDRQMATVGWYAHYVYQDPAIPAGANCHTHGLEETFGHPDFQLVIPLHPRVARGILNELVEGVKSGRRFEPGLHTGVIRNISVLIAGTIEGGRQVLRIILPDRHGQIGPSAEGVFGLQVADLT